MSTSIAIESARPIVNYSDAVLLEQIRNRQVPIAVLGMGHVGLPTALGLAEMGWRVLGADSATHLIQMLQEGKTPFYEPGLQELLQKHLNRNFFPQELERAIRTATILFICVGTPQKPSGEADLSQIEDVARTIARNLNGYKLVVEKSTVPAITAKWIKRTLLRYAGESGRNPEVLDFDVASNPEFLREGSALEDLARPDRVVCGVESDRARTILQELYRPLKAPVILTGTTTAEIIKHAANSFLSMKISFINMVADLCESVGADVEHVAEGLGMDPRIGPGFLKPGIGFGGYCFPKDLRAFIYLAEERGVDVTLLKAVEEINRQRVDVFMKNLRRVLWVLSRKTLAVLGLAFKAGTDDTRESPSLRIVQALLEEGACLQVHDPKAMDLLSKTLHPQPGHLKYCKSPYEAAHQAHALLILTEWPEYRELEWTRLRETMALPLIVDGRNLLDPEVVRRAGFEYVGVGRGAEAADAYSFGVGR